MKALRSLLFIGLCCLLACSKSNEGGLTKTLKIGIDVYPGWGHAFIAEKKGFFKAKGLSVELVLKTDYLETVGDYANGKLDGAFLVFADAIYMNDQGVQTQVPYISDHSVRGDVIFSTPEVASVQDLIGQTIGVEGINSFSHLFVLQALNKHGVQEGDVFFKNINAQDILQEIEKGHIVAAHTYGPAREQALVKGLRPLVYSGEVKGIITDVLAMQRKVIAQYPDEVAALVSALYEAKAYQHSHPDESLKLIAESIGDTEASVASGINAVEYLDIEASRQAMRAEPQGELHVFGEIIADYYFRRGQIRFKQDIKEIIEPRFVESIR